MRNQLNASVWEGHLYRFGLDAKRLNFNTGENGEAGLGKVLMLAGDKLIILSERGTLVIASNTDEYQEPAAQVLKDAAGQFLYWQIRKFIAGTRRGFICVDISNPSRQSAS